jgi:hypothetical protein
MGTYNISSEEPLVSPPAKHLGMVEQMWESHYDKEKDIITFRVFFDTGLESLISIKTETIKKHILKNKKK